MAQKGIILKLNLVQFESLKADFQSGGGTICTPPTRCRLHEVLVRLVEVFNRHEDRPTRIGQKCNNKSNLDK